MPRWLLQVAVGILEQCSELLLEMGDMEMMLNHLKQDVPKWPKPVLQVWVTPCKRTSCTKYSHVWLLWGGAGVCCRQTLLLGQQGACACCN